MPDSMTQILTSGPPGTKINIAVLGDGFAAGDQDLYNTKVQEPRSSTGPSATTISTRTSPPSTSTGST